MTGCLIPLFYRICRTPSQGRHGDSAPQRAQKPVPVARRPPPRGPLADAASSPRFSGTRTSDAVSSVPRTCRLAGGPSECGGTLPSHVPDRTHQPAKVLSVRRPSDEQLAIDPPGKAAHTARESVQTAEFQRDTTRLSGTRRRCPDLASLMLSSPSAAMCVGRKPPRRFPSTPGAGASVCLADGLCRHFPGGRVSSRQSLSLLHRACRGPSGFASITGVCAGPARRASGVATLQTTSRPPCSSFHGRADRKRYKPVSVRKTELTRPAFCV
jgi:hypothetical protein